MTVSLTQPSIGSTNWGSAMNTNLQNIQNAISVACCYQTSSALTINSTDTVINFDTSYFDTDNAVTTGSSWRFQAPSAGKYQVHIQITTTANTGDVWCELQAQTSSDNSTYSTVFSSKTRWDNSGANWVRMAALTAIVNLSAGHYFRARFSVSSTTKTLSSNAAENFIYITKVAA